MVIASIKLLRPVQWIKSIFVLTGMIYSPDFTKWWPVLKTVVAFSFISSAIYIYNDMHDLEEDRAHPLKRLRPLAAGEISIKNAWIVFIIVFVLAFLIAFTVSYALIYILLSYCIINIFYNFRGKKIPWIDVSCIAAGFFLRVLAGTLGVGIPLSLWLAATATMLSFFMALSKRFLELKKSITGISRMVLAKYSPVWLKFFIITTAMGCTFSYIRYITAVHLQNLPFILSVFPATLALIKFSLDVLGKRYIEDDPLLVIAEDTSIKLLLACFGIFIIWGVISITF